MQSFHVVSFLGAAVFLLAVSTMNQSTAQSPHHVYELRMYHCYDGKLDGLKARFRDHTIEIFNRHHMKSVGYWVPEDEPDSRNLLIYVLEHPSREDAEKNWKAFNSDPEWVKVKAASEANGKLVEKIDRYFMDPTDFSQLK
jgi:NIPSNAP protein